MQKPSLPKGTRDFGPIQMARRNYILDAIKATFQLFGYQQIETPAMENLSTLTGKYGDEGDQLLFKVLNSGDFLSKTTQEDIDGGIVSLNKIARREGKIDFDFFETDLPTVLDRYVDMYSAQMGKIARRKYLAEKGVFKRLEERQLINDEAVDGATKNLKKAVADRRGAMTNPRAIRSLSRACPSGAPNGPSWAMGRPPMEITMCSPAPARRTPAATSARS